MALNQKNQTAQQSISGPRVISRSSERLNQGNRSAILTVTDTDTLVPVTTDRNSRSSRSLPNIPVWLVCFQQLGRSKHLIMYPSMYISGKPILGMVLPRRVDMVRLSSPTDTNEKFGGVGHPSHILCRDKCSQGCVINTLQPWSASFGVTTLFW